MTEQITVDGYYMVTEHDKSHVKMTNFFMLIREESNTGELKDIALDGFLPNTFVNDSGESVTLNPGDLLSVKIIGKLMHFANVGAHDERGQLQIEYALYKLNLGNQFMSRNAHLSKAGLDTLTQTLKTSDGQFRAVVMKKIEDAN
jgi:hypothetical protein